MIEFFNLLTIPSKFVSGNFWLYLITILTTVRYDTYLTMLATCSCDWNWNWNCTTVADNMASQCRRESLQDLEWRQKIGCLTRQSSVGVDVKPFFHLLSKSFKYDTEVSKGVLKLSKGLERSRKVPSGSKYSCHGSKETAMGCKRRKRKCLRHISQFFQVSNRVRNLPDSWIKVMEPSTQVTTTDIPQPANLWNN